jgi:protein-L-isoaspartate(D-aspartate) O-methyltransferase (PCMT)
VKCATFGCFDLAMLSTPRPSLCAGASQHSSALLGICRPSGRRQRRWYPGTVSCPAFTCREQTAPNGLTVWEPVTGENDPGRWLSHIHQDLTLITQFDNDEPDWAKPEQRIGGTPTSSSTQPSLILEMWHDADIRRGMNVLEIGAGTGYSTALACERLGSDAVTSVEIDPNRLDQAGAALYGFGYEPVIAVADGLYGYWPTAPFDRIVAACSVRSNPDQWLGGLGERVGETRQDH